MLRVFWTERKPNQGIFQRMGKDKKKAFFHNQGEKTMGSSA